LRDDLDFVIIRENTEDIYAGIEFEQGTPDAKHLIEEISGLLKKRIRPDSGLSIKPISITGSERIVQFAFDYARSNKRRKVTAVHKANIMKHTDGLFLAVARQIADVSALGKSVTYDLKEKRDDPTAVGTSQVADAVVAQLRSIGPIQPAPGV